MSARPSTRLICRYHDGQLQWFVERFSQEPVWVYRTRDEATRILKTFQEATWCKSITDEYARQIEAAILEYDDAQENEDEELRYITETAQ